MIRVYSQRRYQVAAVGYWRLQTLLVRRTQTQYLLAPLPALYHWLSLVGGV